MTKKEKKGKSFFGGVPFFGRFVKGLSKTEPFKKRFEEVDKQIEENLRKGEKRQLTFEADISVRPIIEEAKKEGAEKFIGDDCIFRKKGDKLLLAVKVPQKEVQIELKGKTVKLQAKKWKKIIELPDKFSKITNIRHKDSVLMLELTKCASKWKAMT